MSLKKIILVNLGLYSLLNLIFLLIFGLVGGVGGISIGEFFSGIFSNSGAFLTALFTPGGMGGNIFESLWFHVSALFVGNGINILGNTVGILWIIVPGTISAFVAGRNYSLESTKDSYWGTSIAIFLEAMIPLLIVYIPIFAIGNTAFATFTVPSTFLSLELALGTETMVYFLVQTILYQFLNALFFGGIAAASATLV